MGEKSGHLCKYIVLKVGLLNILEGGCWIRWVCWVYRPDPDLILQKTRFGSKLKDGIGSEQNTRIPIRLKYQDPRLKYPDPYSQLIDEREYIGKI